MTIYRIAATSLLSLCIVVSVDQRIEAHAIHVAV